MTPNVNLTVTERNGRKCVSTGSPWEPIVGYSRAVREGDLIFVTGTVGLEPDGRFGPTLKDQTRRALWKSSSRRSRPWAAKPPTSSGPGST